MKMPKLTKLPRAAVKRNSSDPNLTQLERSYAKGQRTSGTGRSGVRPRNEAGHRVLTAPPKCVTTTMATSTTNVATDQAMATGKEGVGKAPIPSPTLAATKGEDSGSAVYNTGVESEPLQMPLRTGNYGDFLLASLVGTVFGVIGFVAVRYMCERTHAHRLGARVGLGLASIMTAMTMVAQILMAETYNVIGTAVVGMVLLVFGLIMSVPAYEEWHRRTGVTIGGDEPSPVLTHRRYREVTLPAVSSATQTGPNNSTTLLGRSPSKRPSSRWASSSKSGRVPQPPPAAKTSSLARDSVTHMSVSTHGLAGGSGGGSGAVGFHHHRGPTNVLA